MQERRYIFPSYSNRRGTSRLFPYICQHPAPLFIGFHEISFRFNFISFVKFKLEVSEISYECKYWGFEGKYQDSRIEFSLLPSPPFFCFLLFEGPFTSFFKDKKSSRSRNQGFPTLFGFCLMIEGSGSVPLTDGSGSATLHPTYRSGWMHPN